MLRPRPYLVLGFGLVAVSTAATVARLAQAEGMPSLVLAGGRLLIATLALTPFVLWKYRREFRRLEARDWALLAICGATLGAHFATWIKSLEYTTLLASVFFFSTSPIFLVLLSYPLLGERVTRPVVIGTAAAFVGGVLMVLGSDREQDSGQDLSLLGNLLALASAAAFALYLIIGRRFQARMAVVPYIWTVYLFAALSILIPGTLAGEIELGGHTPPAYLWLLYLGLVPQLVGHSSFNYALQHLPAAYVGLISRLEAIGSSILGAVVLGEVPGVLAILGATSLFGGVIYANWKSARGERPPLTGPRRRGDCSPGSPE